MASRSDKVMALGAARQSACPFFESRRSGYVCNRSRTRPRVSANARGLRCAGSEGRYFDVEDICGRKRQARRDDGLAFVYGAFLDGSARSLPDYASQNGQVGTVTHWVDRLDTHWRPDEWTRGGSSTSSCMPRSPIQCVTLQCRQSRSRTFGADFNAKPAAARCLTCQPGSDRGANGLRSASTRRCCMSAGSRAEKPKHAPDPRRRDACAPQDTAGSRSAAAPTR